VRSHLVYYRSATLILPGPAGTSALSSQLSPAILPTLLAQAPSNLFSLLLPRNGTGTLTLGAPPAGLTNVTAQPSLPLLATTSEWATTLASQGVLVNGVPVPFPASNSSVKTSGNGTSLVVGFDSTNLFSVVPASVPARRRNRVFSLTLATGPSQSTSTPACRPRSSTTSRTRGASRAISRSTSRSCSGTRPATSPCRCTRSTCSSRRSRTGRATAR
jgi:hypothetical protein